MPTNRSLARHSAAVLAFLTVSGATTFLDGSEAAAAAPATESCTDVQDPPAQMPAGLLDGDRLFAVDEHNYAVHLVCGRLELAEVTGFDSCYLLLGYDLRRYPC